MGRNIAVGLALVMSLGLLAAGCTEEPKTVLLGSTPPDLAGNSDVISGLNRVVNNNLAPDGGGLSQNDANVGAFQVVFNSDCCSSDGAFAGDNSAIVLFVVAAAGKQRLFASHYNSATLTPPVQLFGEDMDESVAANVASFVCIPLNTSAYTGDGSSDPRIGQVKNNGPGNWLILGEGRTLFRDPVLSDSAGSGNLTTTHARGPRRALYSWLFLKIDRGTPRSSIATGPSATQVERTYRYGFQETGEIVNAALPGGGAAANNVPTSAGASALAVPPNHLTSYGAVTDTFCGTARFGGRALPLVADNVVGTPGVYDHPASGLNEELTAFAFAIPYLSSAAADQGMDVAGTAPLALNDASYRVGEATTFVSAVWTQVCNSFSGGGSFTARDGSSAGGHELQLRSRSFNLATLSWEDDEAQISEPAARNPTADTTSGTAPFTDLIVQNGFLYFKYADASLSTDTGLGASTNQNRLALTPSNGGVDVDWFQRETGGHNLGAIVRTGAADQGFWEEIIALQRFGDSGNGMSARLGPARDVSSDAHTNGGSFGTHTLTNPVVVNNGRDVYPADREMANFNDQGFLLGPDEGMSEYTLFYVMADNSNTTGNPNIDLELCAVVITPEGTPVLGVNPSRVSGTSAPDFHEGVLGNLGNKGGSGLALLADPIVEAVSANNFNGASANAIGIKTQTYSSTAPGYFNLCLNRTGTWAAISYLKDVGLSSGFNSSGSFHQALHVIAYQPMRPQPGAGPVSVVPVEGRFSPPQEVNRTGLLPTTYTPGGRIDNGGIPQALGDAETARNWDNLPVNQHRWQGKTGYRCGFQSDRDLITLFFEQSDSTSDRVWARQMRITPTATGTPTVVFTAEAAELDANDAVPSHATFVVVSGGTSRQGATTAPFIDRQIDGTFGGFQTCDAGVDEMGLAGGVLVVYDKIVDNTNTDGDLGDAEVRVALFDGTVFRDVTPIGIQANEDSPIDGVGGAGDETDPTSSASAVIGGSPRSTVRGLVCVPNNSDIVNAPSYPAAGVESNIYVYFTEPEATLSSTTLTAGVPGTNTVTTDRQRRVALYTRRYTPPTPSFPAGTFRERFNPNPSSAAQPIQIDHDGGFADDVGALLGIPQKGYEVGLVFEAEDQLWFQTSTNGVDYISTFGLGDPKLLTNVTSSAVIARQLFVCRDGTDDAIDALLLFSKNDSDGDRRLHARIGNYATAK